MRRMFLVALVLVAPLMFAQVMLPAPRPDQPVPQGPKQRCCTPVAYDAKGKEIGRLIRWDDRFASMPLTAIVEYRVAGGDVVALWVTPESILGLQNPGGSTVLFTSNDCSGNTAFVQIYNPPLMKRYAMVLPVGSPGQFGATEAWLWVSEHLPSRVNPPPGTVFHSQWGETGSCVPYPAPGYTFPPSPFGGFTMKKIENLYAKFTRPFWVE